jgi:hypothetical protein
MDMELINLVLHVTDRSIASCTVIPPNCEHWFKGKRIKVYYNHFLLSHHHNPYWRKGIPYIWVEEEWRDILFRCPKLHYL